MRVSGVGFSHGPSRTGVYGTRMGSVWGRWTQDIAYPFRGTVDGLALCDAYVQSRHLYACTYNAHDVHAFTHTHTRTSVITYMHTCTHERPYANIY
jgi:hypothetical protein